MKRTPKLSLLVTILFLMGSITTSFGQTLKDVFSNSEAQLVYLGIDFSKAKLLDEGNPNDIRDRLYGSINNLVIDEFKKFDIKGAFNKGYVPNDLSAVTKNNGKANLNEIISMNSADFYRFKESDITPIVRALDLSGKDGVGLLFVIEAMRKVDKKGTAAIWITFVDMKTKKVLMTERVETKATGIGFRNYWASTIKEVIELIDKHKYKEWRNKLSS